MISRCFVFSLFATVVLPATLRSPLTDSDASKSRIIRTLHSGVWYYRSPQGDRRDAQGTQVSAEEVSGKQQGYIAGPSAVRVPAPVAASLIPEGAQVISRGPNGRVCYWIPLKPHPHMNPPPQPAPSNRIRPVVTASLLSQYSDVDLDVRTAVTPKLFPATSHSLSHLGSKSAIETVSNFITLSSNNEGAGPVQGNSASINAVIRDIEPMESEEMVDTDVFGNSE